MGDSVRVGSTAWIVRVVVRWTARIIRPELARVARIVLPALAGSCLWVLGAGGPSAQARPWDAPALGEPARAHAAAGRSAPEQLRVIPFPGTPDASPGTQIIFSTLRPSDLHSVSVTGSSSGEHSGRVELLPAQAGTAFVPDRPFTPGERVRVTATLSSPSARAAEGDPAASRLTYSFEVALQVDLPAAEEAMRPAGPVLTKPGGWMSAAGHGPTQRFRSEPNLRPPALSVSGGSDPGSGDMFLTPAQSPQVGPMIRNARGQLVWSDPVAATEATNLAVQHYEGRPVLTWWQGSVPAPGEDVIMNTSYRTVATVHAGDGYQAELHEFQITPQGTAFITCFAPAYTNLTSVGGPRQGGVIDGVIQEVDIKTGQVLWEWHALGHVPLDASYTHYDRSQFYDFFHLNSIQQLSNGNLLISARNTWAVYEISRKTGKVIWTLGGKRSDFKMGKGTNFEWQHDARLKGDTLSLLDDAADPQEERQSSAKYLKLDTAAMTVSLLRRFTHSPPVLTAASGSVQTLPNGNVFVGWGAQPEFSEYTPSGRQIFNASFAFGVWTYRALRFPWVGRPQSPPSAAVVPGPGGHVKLYASWNGATQVAAWRVLGGSSPHDLKPLEVTVPRSNFETAFGEGSEPPYFAVQAIDRKGRALGTSEPLADPPHLAVFGEKAFLPASGGRAVIPVGCLSPKPCQARVTISAGGRVLGRSGTQDVAPYRAALVELSLKAPGHGQVARVSVRAGSELAASRQMPLRVFSGGSGQGATLSDSAGVQVAHATDFVSSAGRAGIMTACNSAAPCHFEETVSVAGQVVGRTTRAVLGSGELGYVGVRLNGAGRALLDRAGGNRLAAGVQLSVGGRTRRTQIALARYS